MYTFLLLVGVAGSIPPLTFAGICFWLGFEADKLFKDGGALAHWKLSGTQQQVNADVVYAAEKQNRIWAAVTFAILTLIAFALKLTVYRDMAWGLWLLCMLVLMAVCAYVAFVIPWLRRRRMLRDSPDVVIGLYSAVLPGQYVMWNRRSMGMVSSRVLAVTLAREDNEDILTVAYETLQSGRIFVEHSCRIPIPAGNLTQAAQAGQKIAEAGKVTFENRLAAQTGG